MRQETKEVAIHAVRRELREAAENLARASIQQRNNPFWQTGNGDRISVLVYRYGQRVDRLTEALLDLEKSL